MKLWTDEDIKDVEILMDRLHKSLRDEPGPMKQLMILVGQAFAEIKHYKFKSEEMQKTLTTVRDTLEHKKNDDRTSWSLWNECNEALKGVTHDN